MITITVYDPVSLSTSPISANSASLNPVFCVSQVLSYLCQAGADVNPASGGDSPLDTALRKAFEPISKRLLAVSDHLMYQAGESQRHDACAAVLVTPRSAPFTCSLPSTPPHPANSTVP